MLERDYDRKITVLKKGHCSTARIGIHRLDGTMETGALSSDWLGSVYAAAEVLGNITDPLDEAIIRPAWTYMTDNYSKFTIAFWFSMAFHEVGGISKCTKSKSRITVPMTRLANIILCIL